VTGDRGPARLPRGVFVFGTVSLLNDLASEMIYPLLPAFITGVLGAGPAALGALDGAAEFAAAVVKYAAGRLADRASRRGPLVVGGYAAAVLVRPVIALAGAAWQVIGLRVVDRLGKGLRTPPRDAMIADMTAPAQRGQAFGVQRGLDHAGAVLGPVAAWYLLATHRADIRGVIGLSLLPGLAVLALAVWAVRIAPPRRAEAPREALPARGDPPTSGSLAVVGVSGFYLLRLPETLLILRAQELGVAVAVVPLLWAAVHVIKSGTSFLGGHWSDRIGPERTMWGGWLAYALLAAAMAEAHGAGAAWAVFLALGIVAGLTESPERALVARRAGARQGSGFGAYHGITGLAALIGGVALGAVYETRGGQAALLTSGAAGLLLVLAGAAVSARGARAPGN